MFLEKPMLRGVMEGGGGGGRGDRLGSMTSLQPVESIWTYVTTKSIYMTTIPSYPHGHNTMKIFLFLAGTIGDKSPSWKAQALHSHSLKKRKARRVKREP